MTSAILEQHEDSISEYISLICTPVKGQERPGLQKYEKSFQCELCDHRSSSEQAIQRHESA